MKQLFLFILLSGILTGAMAQEQNALFVAKDKAAITAPVTSLNHVDSLMKIQYELDYVRHCLYECHQEKMRGYALSVVGGMMMGIGMTYGSMNEEISYNNKPDESFDIADGMFIVGGVASLVGTIMVIDSEKWLKRAYLGPSGFGVKFVF